MSTPKFTRNTFEGSNFLLESSEAPKIKQGGSSSSDVLNRFNEALAQDMTLMSTRVNLISTRVSRVEDGAATQSGALLSSLQSLSTRVDAVAVSGLVFCDLHAATFVDGASTATQNQVFGQATLPVRSTVDLLVEQDVYGNSFVSPSVEMTYAELTSATISNVNSNTFYNDPDSLYMLKGEQLWVRPTDLGKNQIWIKLRAPLQFRGLTPNVFEFWPFPAFGMDISGIWVKKASDVSTYYAQDLSYLPKYDSTTGTVKLAGPVRLHLDNDPLVEVLICLKSNAVPSWGIHKFKLYHTEYDSSGTIIFKDPFSRTLTTVSLRGKNPSTLATLVTTINTNKATVNMVSSDTSLTPVITGAMLSV